MQLHKVVLVVVAILLAGATASTTYDSRMVVPDTRSLISEESSEPTKGLLRAHMSVGDNGEERGITDLTKLTAPLKAGTSKVFTSARLKVWLVRDKSAYDALVKLKLHEGVDKALASPKLNILDDYVSMLNARYPDKQVSLVGTLTARYEEVALAKAIVLAKRSESSRDIATKLQTQQLEGWYNNQKSVGDVFSLLKIEEDGILSMISRKLETLDEYIKLLNEKNPDHKTTLFRALMDGFGGEDKFALMVSRAMNIPRTSVGAYKYQNALFKRWLAKDYDPMSVLVKVFKIDEQNLAAAGAQEKAIIAAYKPIYNRNHGINEVDNAVVPRRL
ncbi:RxLR effector family [Phytophthora palmivora]|uniref:RxLR effector protein n=1 Tax=Phytophthora palmivora TaxID=4796 RepID=A0A2P4X3N2_9STRA|nr:RxLR effector family [Phytophthora palmivora]